MFILDRYALRLFIKVLLVSFCSITGLIIIVTSVENLDEFITLGRRQGSYAKVLFEFFSPRILTIFDIMYPFLSLLASMFVMVWMQHRNELVAIQAGGVSKGRVVRPLIMASIVLSILGVCNRELAIPRLRDSLVRDVKDAAGISKGNVAARFDHQTEIYLGGGKTIATESAIVKPVFRLPRRLHSFARQIEAEKATYLPANDQHPGGYHFQGVTRPSNVNTLSSIRDAEQMIIETPADSEWLSEGECFVTSGVTFDQLLAGSRWQQFASTAELLAGVRTSGLNYGADARVTIHSRLVQPLLDLTLLCLGLPLVVSRYQRGLFVAIGHTSLVVSVFVTVVMASRALGANYLLSPSLAAWLPLIVFVPIASALAPRFWD